MGTAIYYMDDFFLSDFRFEDFPLQFMDGSLWIHDAAQARRIGNKSYRTCETKTWPPECRAEMEVRSQESREILAELLSWSRMNNHQLRIATTDPAIAQLASQMGISLENPVQRSESMRQAMQAADDLYNRVYNESHHLEEILTTHLVGRAFEDFEGELMRITQVDHVEIECGEDDNSAITPIAKGADVRKYFYVRAQAEDDKGGDPAPHRFKIWVHALYHSAPAEPRFTLITAEN